ncbi:MAG TPA: copper resistance protein CopC [Gaiellaceae bacterium]|nr:copper resistance protein CopC [Gaiellaceae bacterium]
MTRALAAALLAALALPASALAHASLVKESPAYKQELRATPHSIVLTFDQTVELLPNAVEVLDENGRDLARPAHTKGRYLVAPLPRLPRGAYTVRWKTLSTDGHVVSGVYTFGVRVPAPEVTDAVGAEGPTASEDVVRWLYFVGLALLVGGSGFQLFVLRTVPGKRFYVFTGAGAVVVLEAGIIAFLLRSEDALQLPFTAFLYGDLAPIAGGTRFGRAFIAMELGFALVTGLLVAAWITDRRAWLWGVFLLGAGFASGLSLSGHSSSSRTTELADWLHLTAAMLWVGGLVQLAFVVWPTLPNARGLAFRRFSRLATLCVGVLVAAGTYLTLQRLPQLRDLWQTGYGHVLLVKLSLVALALGWGAVHQFVALPRVDRFSSRLTRSLLGESAVAVAVLLAAAVLVDSKPPPPRQVPPPAQVAAHRR